MTAPKLRFKEFSGNWETSPLKALCKINQGLQIAIENRFLEDGENRFFYITNEFLKEGSKKNYFIENPPKSVICDESDILMTRTGNTGQVVTDVKGAFHNNFFKIDFDRSIINRNFFIEFLKKDTTQHLILKYAGASTIPDLNHSDFYRIVMPITTIEEQTKIASFLSAVDVKINQLTQKHQLLSQYKQGMMQKLFSQQIRFKADDGSEFGEWQEKQLGDVCHFINGRAYKQTEWEKEGTPVIRLQNLTGSGKEYYYSTLNLPDHQYCYNNDLLYMWSATFGPIFWQGEKAIFHYHIWKVEVEPQQLDKQYMYYLLDEMTEKMKSSLNGSTMLHVTKQGMESTKKNLPSIEEQTKIANFLSAIDQKIDVVSEQLEQAKLWKKGLLQQMFV